MFTRGILRNTNRVEETIIKNGSRRRRIITTISSNILRIKLYLYGLDVITMRDRLILLMNLRNIRSILYLTDNKLSNRRRANITIIITLSTLMTNRVINFRTGIMLSIRNHCLGLIKSKINLRRDIRNEDRNIKDTILLNKGKDDELEHTQTNNLKKHYTQDNEKYEKDETTTTYRRSATHDRHDDEGSRFRAGVRGEFPSFIIGVLEPNHPRGYQPRAPE